MIPEDLIPHVHGPCLIVIATRDAAYRPHMNLATGARVSADRTQVTCFVPEVRAAPLVSDVEDNGRIAITFADPVKHEAYQLKGRVVSCGPPSREDEAVQDLWKEKTLHAVKPYEAMGVPRLVHSVKMRPAVAVVVQLEQIYDQTPGPRAGTVVFTNASG